MKKIIQLLSLFSIPQVCLATLKSRGNLIMEPSIGEGQMSFWLILKTILVIVSLIGFIIFTVALLKGNTKTAWISASISLGVQLIALIVPSLRKANFSKYWKKKKGQQSNKISNSKN
ncbi:MAG: hypothetical protein RL757_372 [Bacteroidota bacterium]|jgi:hypothetical protein